MATISTMVTFEQEAQYRAWARDPQKFFLEAVKILDENKQRVPFDMRPYQVDCMERFHATQICAVLKARQIGLTTIACAMVLHLVMFHPDRFILVQSQRDEDAKKFFRRIREMYDWLPLWAKARGPQPKGRWGTQKVEFDNGSIIFSSTSSSDHGRGDTPSHVFLDEVGFMNNQEETWTALLPAIEAGGKLWMFGTAKGYRDWFHLKWIEWQSNPRVDTIFYGWEVIEGHDEAWADGLRRDMGEASFNREYPRTADDAFVSSGSNVFAIEVLLEIETAAPRRGRLMRMPTGEITLVDELTHDDTYGFFVYEEPVAGAKYLLAADPSEGLVGGDPSCIQVLRWSAEGVHQSAVYRGRIEPEDFAEQVHQIAGFYNRSSIAVERNNHGMTVLKKLGRLRTPNVIRGGAGRPGLWTSLESKATNIALTRKALADGHVVLHDQHTVDELMSFQEKVKPSGKVVYEGTQHDDHVDALCIGVGYAVTYAPYEQPADEPSAEEPPHPFSFDGLMAAKRLTRTRII